MAKRRSKSNTSCKILKDRIRAATTPKTRGKALGAYSKAGCSKRKRKRSRRKR